MSAPASTQDIPIRPAKLAHLVLRTARFDDVVDVHVRTLKVGNSSFTLEHELVKADSGTTLCRAEVVYVLMATEPFEKTTVPDDLRAALLEGAPGKIIDQSGGAPAAT